MHRQALARCDSWDVVCEPLIEREELCTTVCKIFLLAFIFTFTPVKMDHFLESPRNVSGGHHVLMQA